MTRYSNEKPYESGISCGNSQYPLLVGVLSHCGERGPSGAGSHIYTTVGTDEVVDASGNKIKAYTLELQKD